MFTVQETASPCMLGSSLEDSTILAFVSTCFVKRCRVIYEGEYHGLNNPSSPSGINTTSSMSTSRSTTSQLAI